MTQREGFTMVMFSRYAVLVSFIVAAACARTESGEPADSTISSPQLTAVDSGAPRLLLRDEANASFQEFRSKTLAALARKDTTYLYGMLAPEIRISFGPDEGIDGFRRMWKLDDPDTDVWKALTRVLTMGGDQPTDSNFVAPYVYAFWPDSIDAFGYVAVTGDEIPVQEAPDTSSRVLGVASYSILKFKEWKGLPESGIEVDTTWAQVELPTGAAGWIRGASVYSPVSWRAMFIRRGDRWVMVLFVAGD